MPNVSEITQRVKKIIQDNLDLKDVWTHGKISEVRPAKKGALNFTLTNNGDKIECVIFRDEAFLKENLPPAGSRVSVKGQVYVHATISEYRFKVTDIHIAGGHPPFHVISINDLTNTLKTTLGNHTGEVQGEIAKVFVLESGYTILKLKDVTQDEEVNEVIECTLDREIDSPFPLRQGELVTAEGRFDIFRSASTYRIFIDNPNGLRKPSVSELETPNTCQECGQRCEPPYQLCSICYYAQAHHEGIVVGAVLRYFKAPRFVNFSTETERYIRLIGHIRGRADVVLRRNNEERLSVIAECKRIGYDGNDGIDQLKSYLIASQTKLGLFADDTDPYEWTFLRRNDERNRYDKITRAQFERELGVEPAPEIPPIKTQLEIVHGNIIGVEVDAIVNAADPNLTRGSGVDGAIRDAGGEEIDRECREIFDREGVCPPGRAVITTGGNLLAKYVIHAVGPIYDDGEQREAETLARCYKNSLRLAVEKGVRSIAFPAISTGNFRYPIEQAAPVALKTVKEFVEQARQNNEMVPERIQFVLFDEEAYNCYVNVFSNLGLGLFCLIG